MKFHVWQETVKGEYIKHYALIFGKGHKSRSCSRKVRYSSEDKARKATLRMKHKTGDTFDAYSCPYCDGWHIGHYID